LEPTTKTGEDGVRTLDVNLRPNPIADGIAATQAHTAGATQAERTVMSGPTDEIILDHLANGRSTGPGSPAPFRPSRADTAAGDA
jgi:hypothetical protein